MNIAVVSLFANIFYYVRYVYTNWRRAEENGYIRFSFSNLRNFSTDAHRKVDDYPYGGGAGMILKVEPIYEAIKYYKSIDKDYHVILTSPVGGVFDYKKALELSEKKSLLFICGHYEGYDERVVNFVDELISIGNYILSGGEFAVLSMIDAIIRLKPGVISEGSLQEESFFYDGLLEYPQYTRPYEFLNFKVPDILLSGNHKEIEKWRKKQAIERTKLNNKELYIKYIQQNKG